MDSFFIWTIGCQMNKADSERLATAMEELGLRSVSKAPDADVIVLNSCVVRQSAEEKVVAAIGAMRPIKKHKPDQVLALMGCMVGPNTDTLERRFPNVDVFMRPQEFKPLLDLIGKNRGLEWDGCIGSLTPSHPAVSCYIPIIHGCDLMCTYCIIPYRRGRQVSRPVVEVVREVSLLVQRGVKEVTLLGQTVDAYGYDLADKPDLADLLTQLNNIPGLARIRFLTSHPSFMSDRIIQAVADLPKVCEHINLPVQAGNDEVLSRMRRPYTQAKYRELVSQIRHTIPDVSISTDIIVGFSGETAEQFQGSMDLVSQLRFDKVHCAAYSPRPGTIADRTMIDDIPEESKSQRRKQLDLLQEGILGDINASLVGQDMEILIEGHKKGKWHGRTRSNKLAFFQSETAQLGDLVNIKIDRATPWSLQGSVVAE
jgi:tRNA-2-methylthio-N6-dimethylallyladenosine synthase